MLPATIPLFPLPNVVLFPNVFLPLHIFEPRYRQMVHRALSGERLIGMVLLKPGFEEQYEGTPPVYSVGCAGSITHVERLIDGRFNIVLKGISRFRIVSEDPPDGTVLYRTGHITAVPEVLAESDRELLHQQRKELEEKLAPLFSAARAMSRLPEILSDEDLVNALAQYLALEPVEKQALLELEGPVHRARVLLELLEMKALADLTRTGERGLVH
jgi:Lon protease-like protein